MGMSCRDRGGGRNGICQVLVHIVMYSPTSQALCSAEHHNHHGQRENGSHFLAPAVKAD